MTAIEDAVVRLSVVVPVSRERAFDFFAHRLTEWWPREFTFSADSLEIISLDAHDGGAWYETNTTGSRTDWGTVHQYRAPERLRLSWRISPARTPEPDDSRASEIAISFFAEEGSSTRVELEHSRFHRHAEGAEVMLTGMASAEGWTMILDRFASRVVDNSEHSF